MPTALLHSQLILDACCAINLYLSGRMREILESLHLPVMIADKVYADELTKLFHGQRDDPTQPEGLSLDSMVQSGALRIVSLESEIEESLFIDFAVVLDDGEAISCAIAVSRNWALATDDVKAINSFHRAAGATAITTPEIIQHWAETTKAQDEITRLVIRNVRNHGKYQPRRSHPLYGWWQKHYGG